MALILNLETATTSCSVALSIDEEVIAFKERNERNIHASQIIVFINEVIREAEKKISDLDAVAISMGPGSYTGLRVGVSTAKGLCYALDIPLISLNTLTSMASGFLSGTTNHDALFCPMIDARRMEVYTAIYTNKLDEILPVQAKIIENDSFFDLLERGELVFFGDGAAKCKAVLNHKNAVIIADFVNSARFMPKLVNKKLTNKDFENVAYFEPFYLKDFLPTQPKIR